MIASYEAEFRLRAAFGHADATPTVSAWVEESGLVTGVVCLQAVGSTAGLTTIEYEPGALADLERALEEIAPLSGHYEHNARWGDGNGFSHLRSALVRTALSIPVHGGALRLGTWQQIVLINFDNRERARTLCATVFGER